MIPPPSVYINVQSAHLVDPRTLEIAFDWARCPNDQAIKADWAGATQAADGSWDVRFSLMEERTRSGVPTCTGPVERQLRRIDLTQLLRKDMTHGRLEMNDTGLYGIMKRLPSFAVAFDLR